MPLHGLFVGDTMRRTIAYASAGSTQQVAMNICGQVIGQINDMASCGGVIYRITTEYLEGLVALNHLTPTERRDEP